jgi:hypothetical protein
VKFIFYPSMKKRILISLIDHPQISISDAPF